MDYPKVLEPRLKKHTGILFEIPKLPFLPNFSEKSFFTLTVTQVTGEITRSRPSVISVFCSSSIVPDWITRTVFSKASSVSQIVSSPAWQAKHCETKESTLIYHTLRKRLRDTTPWNVCHQYRFLRHCGWTIYLLARSLFLWFGRSVDWTYCYWGLASVCSVRWKCFSWNFQGWYFLVTLWLIGKGWSNLCIEWIFISKFLIHQWKRKVTSAS